MSKLRKERIASNLNEEEVAEALRMANYSEIIRQLDHFYGQGMSLI